MEAEKEVGDGADGAGDHPGEADDEHALAAPEVVKIAGKTTAPAQQRTQPDRDRGGNDKRRDGRKLQGEQGHGHRGEHDQAERHQDKAEGIADGGGLHRVKAFLMASASLAMVNTIN